MVAETFAMRFSGHIPYIMTPEIIYELNIPALEKLQLLYMVKYYNSDKGYECYISYQTIGDYCSFSRRTAIRNMASLVVRGIITIEKRRNPNTEQQTTNIYTLHLETLETITKIKRKAISEAQGKAITRKYTNIYPVTAADTLDWSYGLKTIDPKTGEIIYDRNRAG